MLMAEKKLISDENMTSVKWIDDSPGLSVIEQLGLSYTTEVIAIKDIDRKESAQNRARETPLDKERAHGIARAINQDVPIPRLVLRKRTNGKRVTYVVAGGNHRLFAIADVNRTDDAIEAHIVDCSNEEFELLCRLLNTVVGEGASKSQRLTQAMDAVDRLGLTVKKASDLYHLSSNELKKSIQSREIRMKFELSGKKKVNATQISAIGMKCIDNDNVLGVLLPIIAKHSLKKDQVRELSKRCEEQKTEQDMIAAAQLYSEEMDKVKERPIPRPRRSQFLRLISGLETAVTEARSSKTVLEYRQFSDSESEEVRIRCKKLATILSCL